jgi:hypothetical protein
MVDHAVIRGLVTARPWCVAGLPLSTVGSRVPSVLSRIALTGSALRRARRMMIRQFFYPALPSADVAAGRRVCEAEVLIFGFSASGHGLSTVT